jgi:hypothetical protein
MARATHRHPVRGVLGKATVHSGIGRFARLGPGLKFGLITVALGALGSLVYGLAMQLYVDKRPIQFFPDKVALSTVYAQYKLFDVHNRSQTTLYSVMVTATADNAAIGLDQYSIRALNVDPALMAPAEYGGKNFDVVVRQSMNPEGKAVYLLMIYRLSPGDKKTFRIGVRPSSTETKEATVRVTLKTLHFATEPTFGFSRKQPDGTVQFVNVEEGFGGAAK